MIDKCHFVNIMIMVVATNKNDEYSAARGTREGPSHAEATWTRLMPADDRCHHGVLGSRRTSLIWPWNQKLGQVCHVGRVQARGSTQRRGPRTAIEQRLGKSATAAWYTSSAPTATLVSAPRTRAHEHMGHSVSKASAWLRTCRHAQTWPRLGPGCQGH